MPALTDQILFGQPEFEQAADLWGCNCGPSALAAALGWSLNEIRELLVEVGFEERGYMSPTMMKDALRRSGRQCREVCLSRVIDPAVLPNLFPVCGLIRVQWTGPWTDPGSNPRWAYNYTHWISGFNTETGCYVFDCNGGARTYQSWREEIVPLLTESIPRGDGGWFGTHIWEVT